MSNDAKILEAIKEVLDEDNKLTCKKAEEIADKFEVPKGKIGKLCNEHKIKLKGCQLGCF